MVASPAPSEIDELRARLAETQREAADRQRQLERYARDLRETFKRERAGARELAQSYRATVQALANAVEARDAYTGKHAERVAAYGLEIGRAIDGRMIQRPEIEFAFLLHDIGKVAIPDTILFKSTGLNEQEYALMSRHPVIGFEILRDIDFLGDAKLVVLHHHERWDGRGYPTRLSGDEIPLAARIFAVADALDALTTDRPYRPAASFDHARAELRAHAGTQFDPKIIAAFEQVPAERFAHLREEAG
jgi:HD-GYP domain-containing protein (c-di-GMP phosphodiesterase class II)